MQKLFKISLIFAILSCFYITVSHAETTNIYNDVVNESTTSNTSNTDNSDSTSADTTNTTEENEDDFDLLQEDLEEDLAQPTSQTSSTPASTYSSSVNTMSSISEANLGLNNVLCIILIAIGTLMILLAIAILIRLNK